jgi:hypothetical protein
VRIEIDTNSDTWDCETCGTDWAEGGRVIVDGKLTLEADAVAHCYNGTHYSEMDLLVMALHKKGISVYVDGDLYHVTCHHDDYHGEMK